MRNFKETKLENAESDSGWVVDHKGRCYTTWKRHIKTTVPAKQVAETLFAAGDYPGWTGIGICKSDEGVVVLRSTWDSSD